jgi:hypothetical protein
MRITTSDITLAASQISVKTTSTYEHLRKWNATSDVTTDSFRATGSLTKASVVKKDTFNANGKITGLATLKTMIPKADSDPYDQLREIKKKFFGTVKEQIMKDMIEMITGKKITVLDPSSLQGSDTGGDGAQNVQGTQTAEQGQAPQRQGWGVDYYYKETQTTKDGVAVSASGTVTTADGKRIDFTASLEMTHETYNELTISVKAGDALIDPLMIDTTGKGVALSGDKFKFDLNANGIDELINTPAAGTGFLAYDRNGNGIVDNGSELFGPATGKGFSELSQFDTDKNGWIDENDAVFNNLSVWQKNADGTDSMTSLKNSGVGAIYLGHAASRFDLTDVNNPGSTTVAGVLRDTGLFLRETGQTGFIQEVDLVA